MSCSRRLLLSAMACGAIACDRPAQGMLWQQEAERPRSGRPENELAFVARLRYAGPSFRAKV